MKAQRWHKIFWGSSYDRGLDILLFMWDEIRKEVPDVELHICYGWDMFDKVAKNNPERMKWKASMVELMEQEGIIHHGRLSKDELAKVRQSCGIWAYPTYFTEINCITALDCQKDGVVPVVCDFKSDFVGEDHYTALSEVIKQGIIVRGDIKDLAVQKEYVNKLVGLLKDYFTWSQMAGRAKLAMKNYTWPKIAEKWLVEFAKPIATPKVSIITPTIRRGFWNLMANNLANQTYTNFEWIVVDDFPKDRAYTMKKYCQKNRLDNFKYVRGGKTDKFYYGLSTANNIGWQNSEGELLVFLQDFVLLSPYGIEALVDIYRHNPDTLIAPTDTYYSSKYMENVESEDWFDGKTDVQGKFLWKNKRNQNIGIRPSRNPFDFEMNYGAIPKKIVDAVGGWWEFFNDGLGFDNTEIAYRAMSLGYRLLIDDTNQAVCIDHWKPLAGNQTELGEKRTLRLNDPRYYWLLEKIKEGKLDFKRDPKKDNFRLFYEMPPMSQDEATLWIREHQDEIIKRWDKIL